MSNHVEDINDVANWKHKFKEDKVYKFHDARFHQSRVLRGTCMETNIETNVSAIFHDQEHEKIKKKLYKIYTYFMVKAIHHPEVLEL